MPEIVGGSADLTGSNLTNLKVSYFIMYDVFVFVMWCIIVWCVVCVSWCDITFEDRMRYNIIELKRKERREGIEEDMAR